MGRRMERTTSVWWTPRTIDVASLSICMLVAMAAYAFAIGPLVEKRASMLSQRRELQELSKKCAELKASVADMERSLVPLREQLAKGQIRLESANGTNKRIAKLATLLGDCGLEIDDVKIGNLLTSKRCTVVPIGIAGRGGYHKSVALLHELNRTFADISVAEFELIGNPTSSEQSNRFRVELIWYTAPELQASLR
jgi:Tfp pilus assembly protein PilO